MLASDLLRWQRLGGCHPPRYVNRHYKSQDEYHKDEEGQEFIEQQNSVKSDIENCQSDEDRLHLLACQSHSTPLQCNLIEAGDELQCSRSLQNLPWLPFLLGA